MEVKNLTEFCLEPLLNKLISGIDTSQLRVEIEYASRPVLDGSWRLKRGSPLIRLSIDTQNQYPCSRAFKTGEYYVLDRSRKFVFQEVDFETPEELIAGVFLHELSHHSDFQGQLRPQYPEIRADKFALAELERFGIGVRQSPRVFPLLPEDLEDTLLRLDYLLGLTQSPPKAHRLFDRADIPWFPYSELEAETSEQLKKLDEYEQNLPKRSKLKEIVREKRYFLEWHLSGLKSERQTRETRRELEGRKWAYVNIPLLSRGPNYGDKVRIVTLGPERAKVVWNGKRRVIAISHLSAEKILP